MPGYNTYELWSTQGDRRVPREGALPGFINHLDLDNGEERLLTQGDCVIPNGTRNAWRNR